MIPVYNGADSIGELVAALEELRIAGGHEIVLVNDGSPDNSLEVCRALVERARVPITLVALSRNYGEHNAVMAGLRHAAGAHVITMDDDLQNPPEEVERLLAFAQQSGREVVYTYYDEKQHAAWRNLGSRFTNWVAGFVLDKPKGFYLSSFRCISAFVVREITRYDGPYPYVDGLILQVTQDIDRLLRAPSAARGRPQQLHAAPAAAAVAQHVRQFLGDAAAAQHVGRVRVERCSARSAASPRLSRRWCRRRRPAGPRCSRRCCCLSGVQLLILGLVGEYLGRLYLTANSKPQSMVRVGDCAATRSPRPPPLPSRRCAKRRERPPVALYYLSLACAVLFGIAGQIALKSGAVGARQHRGAASSTR